MSQKIDEAILPHVRALETLLARRRAAGGRLLDHDAWDRWGRAHASAEDVAARDADLAAASTEHAAASRELEALVAALRTEAPGAITAWADTHATYLARFAETTADATARHVAETERAAWAEVARGQRAFVDENVFYVPGMPPLE